MNEAVLKRKFEALIERDFDFEREVEGKYLVDGTKVVADYLIKAKKHLIHQGFTSDPIVVEIKTPKDTGNRMVRVAWQAITYSLSSFRNIRPPFVLIYPSLSEFEASDHKKNGLILLTSLLQKANVGTIEFSSDGSWTISAPGAYYFSSSRGLSKNKNGLLKRYVGTWK